MLKRHPVAALAALLILPLSLPVIEVTVFTLARFSSTFSFMLFDLFPAHEGVRTLSGIPYYAAERAEDEVDRLPRGERQR